MAYEQLLGVEVNGCYQAIVVASDVEDVEVPAINRHSVHAGESPPQFFKIAKAPMPYQLKPRSQGCGSVGMFLFGLPDRLLRNHMHQPKAYLNLRFNVKSGRD
jgi:hypothetical protein